ncbi:MAG: DUF4392 domain-containing protein [Gammaproteobacteria bacterium]|nr:DUF4392 domain-containing protein [Gammaproteobacteria bacterium]
MNDLTLSQAIEALMVARNLRNMQVARSALLPDYYLRAAQMLRDISGTVIIGTGFPVADTFETDGPLGAIALYDSLQALGAEPVIACGPPLSDALAKDYRVLPLVARDLAAANAEAAEQLRRLNPAAVISIERPGLAEDGRYYNMRGEDITARCRFFDPFLTLASCPTIAIGDGGNEIGMGNIRAAIASLDIHASVTGCDELLVADVSNWGAYGLIALLARWSGRDLLAAISPLDILDYLSTRGSVDGVTRENTLTEDGLPATEGMRVIQELRILTGFPGH